MRCMFRRLAGSSLVLAVVVASACCNKGDVTTPNGANGSAGSAIPGKPSFTIFALAEVRGQIGPCGCTSDPLGAPTYQFPVAGATAVTTLPVGSIGANAQTVELIR